MALDMRAGVGAAMLLAAAGCVTINIYFPAAAAEKAADRIIEEVWQLREGQRAPAEPGAGTAPGAPAAEGAKP
ncbi:MAG: hypothetical protein EYC67_15510 [Betaproteobacteria bacterium]|nr:MAG: hypothetical protein EYC67_15510 [Betaproteobacteria bacterium]